MANELVNRFLQLVRKDPSVQERLRTAKDQEGLAQLSVQIGSERGLHFSVQDVIEKLKEITGGSRELTDAELEAVAGAGGISDDVDCDG
jgi:predicted ribosomally synthesized peptide with nif11-like leader